MRDLYPRLFEPPFLSPGVPNPRHLDEGEYRAARYRRRRQGRAAERGPRPGGGRELRRKRLRRDQGDRAGTRRGTRGARRPRALRAAHGSCAIPVRARATAELFPAPGGVSGAGERRWVRAARSPTGRASRCGRTSRSRSTAWRRPRAGGRPVPRGHERLSLRCRAGAAVRRPSGPEMGRSARREPPPVRHRARPRPAGRVRMARGERAPVRLRAEVLVGAVALRLHPRRRQLLRRLWRPRRRRRRHPRRPVIRAGAVRAADRPRGAALERVRAAARRAALRRVGLQPVRALAGRRRGHRPVHARHGRRGRPRRPVRPRCRDQRPGAPDA